MAKRKATKLGPPDWRVGGMRSEWVPGTEPGRTEPMTVAEVVELVIGFVGIAFFVACLYAIFACAEPNTRDRWVPSHWEGDVWVQGHHEGDPLPVD